MFNDQHVVGCWRGTSSVVLREGSSGGSQKILPTINMVMGRLVVPQHPNHGQQTWSVVSGKTKS